MANSQNLKPFKKGKSGNSRGRPPIVKELKTFFQEKLSAIDPLQPDKINLEAVVEKLIQLGLKGNLKAIEMIFNYAYGKPKENGVAETDVCRCQNLLRNLQKQFPDRCHLMNRILLFLQ